jgi:hypothetical protein
MKLIRLAPALALALSLPLVAHAMNSSGTVAKQVSTASAHAGMAVGAADLKTAHAHLQHVINCLVGPSGQAYDAQAEDPCKGMGQGAMVDAKGDAAQASMLQTAVNEAEHGLQTTTLDDAHADAQKVLSTLQAR